MRAMAVRGSGRFGVRAAEPEIAWDAVRAHVRRAIDTIAPTDSAERYEGLGATVLRGHARFVGPATRSRWTGAACPRAGSWSPPAAGLPCRTSPASTDVPFLTNETLFDLPQRPDHLLILGGGPVGLEMAQAHAGLGCRVTVVQRGRIAPKDEPELVDALRAVLRARRHPARERHRGPGGRAGGPVLVLADGSRIAGSHLLVAAGRVPSLDGLDLAAGRVQTTERGVATDAGLRSPTNHRVFAAGDIADPAGIGPRNFTHVGSYHASIIVRRALFRLPARISYAALPRVTYTAPELAQVGLTEAEARAAGHRVEILIWPLAENDRAIAEADTAGLVKLVVARGRVLGAGTLAPHAGEMAGLWTLAIQQRTKLSTLAGLVVPYPTRAEAGKRAAGSAFTASLFASRTRRLVRLLARLP